MINRKFVRAVIIEGLPDLDAAGKRWLEQFAKSNKVSVIIIKIEKEDINL